MVQRKKIGKIALLAMVPWMVPHAAEKECGADASYFLTHFSTTKDPENFNLRWAACEEKLGNEDAAISAYERVLMVNPDNVKAMTALAGLYGKNHMSYESDALKQSVDNSRLTPRQRQIVAQLLEGEESLVSTRFSATLNFGYDNNLNFGIFTPESGKSAGEVESAFHALSLSGNYVNELDAAGGFSFQSNVNFYWQDNYSAHYYDTLYGSIDAGVGYSRSGMLLYFPLVYRQLHNLDADLYEQYGVAPRFTTSLGSGLLMNIDVKYLKRRYFDDFRRDADDTLSNAALGFYKFYGENYIYAQAKYNRFEADSSTPSLFIEYNYTQLFAGFSYGVDNIAVFGVNYQYGKGDYKDYIPETAMKREDDFNQINVSIERELMSKLKVIAAFTYTDNDSNYASASYNKQTVTVGLQYNY